MNSIFHNLFLNNLISSNCTDSLQFYDLFSGNLNKEIWIDIERIVENEKTRAFRFIYPDKIKGSGKPSFRIITDIREKKSLINRTPTFEFLIQKKEVVLMISYLEYNRSDYYYTYIVIPFDWDAMEIDYTSGSVKCNYIQNMIYKLENNNNNKYSAGTYFIDFSNSVRFGYIDKKSKEFIIEEVPN